MCKCIGHADVLGRSDLGACLRDRRFERPDGVEAGGDRVDPRPQGSTLVGQRGKLLEARPDLGQLVCKTLAVRLSLELRSEP